MRWAGHLARMGEGRGEYRILMGKPEEKMLFGTPKCSWDDIKIELQEAGWEGMYRINMAQDHDIWLALVNTIMNFWIP